VASQTQGDAPSWGHLRCQAGRCLAFPTSGAEPEKCDRQGADDYGKPLLGVVPYLPSNQIGAILTFEWTNLLLACGVCNGAEHKSDHFPEAAEGGPLVNPCDDDPRTHFDFCFDPVARLASVYGKTRRGMTTETVLGLNRTDLREYRSRSVCRLFVLAQYADSDPAAAALLNEAKQASAEYAAFARTL
jgi:hypothetical protein